MPLIYVSQDGCAPSGITTYGLRVLEAWPDARMLLLNTSQPPVAWPAHVHARVDCISETEAHNVHLVAARLGALAATMPGDVTVMPNTGDTVWSAVVAWLRDRPTERARVRVLGVVHSDVETQYAGALRHARFAAAWIGVSRRCTEVLWQRFGRSPGVPVFLLSYPTPLPEKPARISKSGPLRLIYAGRLEETQKRVSRLASVFEQLVQSDVVFNAVLAGDGPARTDLEAAIRSSAASAQVRFVGTLGPEQLVACLLESDVFLLTSDFEGLPLALLEAMASGVCPVVMHVSSGLDDVLVDGENAAMVPAGDVAGMVAAIGELARDRERLAWLGAAARETVGRQFSTVRHFTGLVRIIKDCWKAPPPDPNTVESDPTADAIAWMVQRAQEVGGPAIVYGAGMFGRKLIDACLDAAVPVVGWLDSDPKRSGSSYRELTCAGPTAMGDHGDAAILVGSLEFASEIATIVRQKLGPETVVVVAPGAR